MEFSREEEENVQVQELTFFKVIRGASLRAKKLMLPKKFARDCGGKLSGKATLLDPNGLSWDMKIVKERGATEKFWFKNGWKDFADYYSLSHGDFVVFHYKGRRSSRSSHEFSIIIFDGEAEKEMDYPLMTRNGSSSSNNIPQKYPSFTYTFTTTSCRHKLMNIPVDFYEEHMKKNEVMRMIQIGIGRKRWNVQMHPCGQKYMRVYGKVWKRFVEENSVKEGDICKFKLVDENADGMLLLQATIFHRSAE
ncbi:B3 domain-containing protein At4g01580 [Linum perenne]